jgi:hypothetical protein
VDDEELEVGLLELIGLRELTDSQIGRDQVCWDNAGGWDLAADVVALAVELNADLELDLDAGQELELKREGLVLDTLWNGFKIIVVIWGREVVDLVVEVVDLAFEDDAELEENAELLLVGADRLELVGQILALRQLVLKSLSLFWGQISMLKLVL